MTSVDYPRLADPYFIDAIGQLVHSRQADGYQFSIDLMGYQACSLTAEKMIKQEKKSTACGLSFTIARPFIKPGRGLGSQLADILLRNELDTATSRPVGEIDYASDLEYRDQVLKRRTDWNGTFQVWCRDAGLNLINQRQKPCQSLKTV